MSMFPYYLGTQEVYSENNHDDMVCMKCGLTWKAVYPDQKKECPQGHKNVKPMSEIVKDTKQEKA